MVFSMPNELTKKIQRYMIYTHRGIRTRTNRKGGIADGATVYRRTQNAFAEN